MEIQGYPNYLIYPDGRVYNKKYKRFLRGNNHNMGYKSISLYYDNKNYDQFLVHRLVALHYISNPDNKPQVDHINRDRQDNRVENLRWVTNIENNVNKEVICKSSSGHRNIHIDRRRNHYNFIKNYNGKQYNKSGFKTLKEALCYKYIFTLKIRAGLI